MPNGVGGGIHLGDAVLRILGDMGPLNKSLGDLEGKMASTGQGLANMGQTMTKAITLPIVAGLGAAVYKASDFDAAMRNLNSVAQLSEDQFADLRERVIDFSTGVTAGAGEIAGAMTDVAAAGYDAEDSFTIIQAAMLGAEAGMAEVLLE